ncbi:MAG: hypothetical protein ACFFCP_09655 [Promethearchaeota archaeon]
MPDSEDITNALELFGFLTGDRKESRLMGLLETILRIQQDPPLALSFSEIYDGLHSESPETKLSKAWVHRILKSLVEAQLIRLESPSAHRKKYIADVNTVMAGLEQLKARRIQQLEAQREEISNTLEEVGSFDCGELAQHFVKSVTGIRQKVSSRIVRGVEELHRVLRYNMLDIAGKGDKIRATVLWLAPFVGKGAMDRMMSFIEAARRGAEVRYLITEDMFRIEEMADVSSFAEDIVKFMGGLIELRKEGVKFDVRIYSGPKTYNQVSINNENMALIISEKPVTATWITRDFNPDLIDNAVRAFDRDWKRAKSFLEMTPDDLKAFGVEAGGLISRLIGEKG